jgi:ferrochelatase
MTDLQWSVLDRWPNHPTHVRAVAQTVLDALAKFPAEERHRAIILFSAHSLPLKVLRSSSITTKKKK